MSSAAVQLFEENKGLVLAAIEQHFGSYHKAHKIAGINNMEFGDFVQIGNTVLWELCKKYNPEKKDTFKGYVFQSVKWRISTEIHKWGLPMKIPVNVSMNVRNSFQFTSVDLESADTDSFNFFAVDEVTNVEEEVIDRLACEELLDGLSNTDKFILSYKALEKSDEKIGEMIGEKRSWVAHRRRSAIEKLKERRYENCLV